MKLLEGQFKNFGSYKELEFSYADLGLALVSGPTGSGKSTLMDAAAWALYGVTSKDTAADDIKSWGAEDITTGELSVDTGTGQISVFRKRGKPSQNDLYWLEEGEDYKHRGKDATETQKLLEDRLGVTAELYFTSAYFHQFSKADAFFISKSKERRDLLEKIADLSLPIKVADAAKELRKETNQKLTETEHALASSTGRLNTLAEEYEKAEKAVYNWQQDTLDQIQKLSEASEAFEDSKKAKLKSLQYQIDELNFVPLDLNVNTAKRADIEKIRPDLEEAQRRLVTTQAKLSQANKEMGKFTAPGPAICPTCLGSANNVNKEKHVLELKQQIAELADEVARLQVPVALGKERLSSLVPLSKEYEVLQSKLRTYDKLKEAYREAETSVNTHSWHLERIRAATNPHEATLARLSTEFDAAHLKKEETSKKLESLKQEVIHLTQVYDLSLELRGLLLQKTVKELEQKTNNNLLDYFDGEIKVLFALDGEKLDATIEKNGYDASFRQLSGGQRCQLKLCFGVALMEAAANQAGTHFDNLFFDESLNGLDDGLKLRAFSLFQKLESNHGTIIMIEHSEEFKSMFANRYSVSLEGDNSTIKQISNGQ